MPDLSSEPSYTIHIEADDAYVDAVDVENLRAAVIATLLALGRAKAELSVIITDDEAVHVLNRDYRGVDAPTDVLSFVAHEGDEETLLPPEAAAELADYLGDILIAYPYSMAQAQHYGADSAAELRLLVVHGTLHLLGYDHDSPEAETAMWAVQEDVLAQFGDHGLSLRRYDP